MSGDSSDVHCSGGDVDEEQDMVCDKPFDGVDLYIQEVRRHQTLPVSLQKGRPSGVRVAFSQPPCPTQLYLHCSSFAVRIIG
jgi:hypothetical protein